MKSASNPQFHLVVRRSSRLGPLAPYRFSLSVLFALLVAGRSLWLELESGTVADDVLLRAGGAALFMWIVSGIVNRILTTTPAQPIQRAEPPDG